MQCISFGTMWFCVGAMMLFIALTELYSDMYMPRWNVPALMVAIAGVALIAAGMLSIALDV